MTGDPARRAFLRPRAVVRAAPGARLTLGDLADVAAPADTAAAVRGAAYGSGPVRGRAVVPLFALLARAEAVAPDLVWEVVGDRDVVVEAIDPPRPGRVALAALVWVVLFLGAATALLNFHADVNMPAAQRTLYYLATGRRAARPLAVEIPYAVGLAAGASLFFAVPRGAGDEPGPLELEVVRYEERLRAYWRLEAERRRAAARRGGRPR